MARFEGQYGKAYVTRSYLELCTPHDVNLQIV